MGMNFKSCCHRCRVMIFHYRNEEFKTLPRFYRKHSECMKLKPSNLETLEDQIQEAWWMDGERGYPNDSLQDDVKSEIQAIQALKGDRLPVNKTRAARPEECTPSSFGC